MYLLKLKTYFKQAVYRRRIFAAVHFTIYARRFIEFYVTLMIGTFSALYQFDECKHFPTSLMTMANEKWYNYCKQV